MLEGLKSVLESKKFWSAVVGSAVCTALGLLHMPSEVIMSVAGMFGLQIGSQGYVDSKKP